MGKRGVRRGGCGFVWERGGLSLCLAVAVDGGGCDGVGGLGWKVSGRNGMGR